MDNNTIKIQENENINKDKSELNTFCNNDLSIKIPIRQYKNGEYILSPYSPCHKKIIYLSPSIFDKI